jgi:hypothetical protein
VKTRTQHLDTCVPNINKQFFTTHFENEMKSAINGEETIPSAFKQAVAKAQSTGIDIIHDLPNYRNVKSSFYRKRNRTIGVSKLVYVDVREVEVPRKFISFLLADYSYENERILIFCSDNGRNLMSNLNTFLGDGTFQSCPTPFVEIYSIHGDMSSSQDNTHIVPLVYALLSQKTKRMYILLFSLIKSRIPTWEPHKLITDFELPAIDAFKTVFPEAENHGCYYHYTKSLWRKAKELGINKSYYTRKPVALCNALPLLPSNKIMEGWEYVKSEIQILDEIEFIPESEKLKLNKFKLYMERFWLRDAEFIRLWCAFGERHRTTNFVEAWHSGLNKSFKKTVITLYKLLQILSNDAMYYTVYAKKIQENVDPGMKRDYNFIVKDILVLNLQMKLVTGEVTVPYFLEKSRPRFS